MSLSCRFFIMNQKTKIFNYLPSVVLALSLAVIYLKSMAPGLTWANDGADGGDFITAAFTGGVAHPTGYPVYLSLARLFQLLPVGTLAFRTNLMSATAAVIAVLVMHAIVIRSFPGAGCNRISSLVAAYAFGLSPLFWSQAVITEVYTLHALFVALLLYLSSVDSPMGLGAKARDRISGLTLGLALGNHLTSILLLPLLGNGLFQRAHANGGDQASAGWRPALDSVIRRSLWCGVGLSAYAILPIRALANAPVNWGNPLTLERFGWLVSGRLYQEEIFALTPSFLWSRVRAAAGLLTEQFGIPGLVLGLIGVIVFYRPSRLYLFTLWIFTAFTIFAIIYSTHDSFMYLIPAYLCFAIWIGAGLDGLLSMLPQHLQRIAPTVSLLVLSYFFILAGSHWRGVDASHDLRAEEFGTQVMAQSPENAIVFANGDKALFTAWYFHFALGQRPDLVVVSTGLLPFDWYQETLRSTYPGLILPGPFPFAEQMIFLNPARPVCYIEYTQMADIQCESGD